MTDTEDDLEGLPARLRALRARRKLTQRALADAMGVSAATVANIELGKKQPRVQTLVDWLVACGLDQGDLDLAADFVLVLGLADASLKRSLHAQFRALIDDLSR